MSVEGAPGGLSERAAAFWAAVVEGSELNEQGRVLLAEAVRTITEIDSLAAALVADGVTVQGSTGQPRVNPAVAEIRQHRMSLARLLKALPGEEVPESQTTRDARAAANSRWALQRARDEQANARPFAGGERSGRELADLEAWLNPPVPIKERLNRGSKS